MNSIDVIICQTDRNKYSFNALPGVVETTKLLNKKEIFSRRKKIARIYCNTILMGMKRLLNITFKLKLFSVLRRYEK